MVLVLSMHAFSSLIFVLVVLGALFVEEVLRASFDCPHPCIDGKECLMAIND